MVDDVKIITQQEVRGQEHTSKSNREGETAEMQFKGYSASS